jgi:ABC-type antimicrobial peptide transport system permease subunit
LFYLVYMLSELRRRKGRTILTALGLAVGVGLVVTVSALSNGLDRAQDDVLDPLTGVGTDMSVSRPLRVSGSGSNQQFTPGPPGASLSRSEQRKLRAENGGNRFGLQRLGAPGERFSKDDFVSTSQLSFPESRASQAARIDGVEAAAGSLTLAMIHLSGRVPREAVQRVAPLPPAGGPPRSIGLEPTTVSGVDTSKPGLGLVSPGQVRSGRYFQAGKRREAILSQAYARRKQLSVGDSVKLGGKRFEVVGIANLPLGGQASDIYVRLGELQKISGREGRINGLQVRATDSSKVSSVASEIERTFAGARVTTAKQLADRVSGSLVDAKNLSSKLGAVLAIIGLAAAFLIAGLLTLSSVNKRTRELGTLKALGWPQRLVVRQIAGESLAQGALGGVLGALAGLAGAALASAIAPTLKATVASAAAGAPGPLAFGQGSVVGGSTSVALDAPVDASLLLLAVGLALLGGLVSGVAGGLRAARLRPADALRSVE